MFEYIMQSFLNKRTRARLFNLICLMGVKIEFLSIWNRNFDTIGTRHLAIVSKSTIGRFPLFTRHFITRYICTYTRIQTYPPTHALNARTRLFTASVRERKSSFPTHQYRLHRYLATLVFSARSKSLFGRGGPLLLHPIVLPLFPPPLSPYVPASRCIAITRRDRRVTMPMSNVK